jgi:hypothetical protein
MRSSWLNAGDRVQYRNDFGVLCNAVFAYDNRDGRYCVREPGELDGSTEYRWVKYSQLRTVNGKIVA